MSPHESPTKSAFSNAAEADQLDKLYNDLAPKVRPLISGCALQDPNEEDLSGTDVEDFKLLRKLGHGGMGIVYLARQQHPSRDVAVKINRSDVNGGTAFARCSQEPNLQARVKHPGIAEIYVAGEFNARGRKRTFFAMELVSDARDICKYATDVALQTTARLRLFAQNCDAVDNAHKSGVIHRDLKPSNILIDGDGHPKITDFGVASSSRTDTNVDTTLTAAGSVIGTLAYMSPEQASGDTAVDKRTDVYSLGVVLYELLSGRLPHEVSNKSLHDALRAILQEVPIPLSRRDRSLRGDLETIVSKALEREPDRRYQSAGEFAADIRRFLNKRPIKARPTSVLYSIRCLVRRRPVSSLLLIALAVMAYAFSTADIRPASRVFNVRSSCVRYGTHGEIAVAYAGDVLQFEALRSNGGGTMTAVWDFGDGTQETGQVCLHKYTSPGTYCVKLEVADEHGDTALNWRDITIELPPLRAIIEHADLPTEFEVGRSYGFRAKAFGGNGAFIFSWRVIPLKFPVGGGLREDMELSVRHAGRTCEHVFDAPGFYRVELEVVDTGGRQAQSNARVKVKPLSRK